MDIIQRFLTKVHENKNTGCWEWHGPKNKGYGILYFKGKKFGAHRWIYSHTHQAFNIHNTSQHICHRCDNPGCVNPDHLFLGTHQDNMQDKKNKGRTAKGKQNGRALLNAFDILAIRKSNDTLQQLGDQYGVHWTTIHQIKKRLIWKHV